MLNVLISNLKLCEDQNASLVAYKGALVHSKRTKKPENQTKDLIVRVAKL